MTARYYNDKFQILLRIIMTGVLALEGLVSVDRKTRNWLLFIVMMICGTICMLLELFWKHDLSLPLSIPAYVVWAMAGSWGALLQFCSEARLLQAELDISGPRLEYLRLKNDNWELHENLELNQAWFTENRDTVRLQVTPSDDFPFALDDEHVARTYFEKQAKELHGVLIDLNCENIGGLQAISRIFKYRMPPQVNLGMYYVAVTWIAFDGFTYQINFESGELGETGIRECVVEIANRRDGVENTDFKPASSGAESRTEEIAGTAPPSFASDSGEYDDQFPEHPLSKVRAYQKEFRETVVIDDILMSQPQYKYKTQQLESDSNG